ncbi:MAG: hypothetical protein WBW57_14120, partial [Candidatus Sulfotelmatobacter sp.]
MRSPRKVRQTKPTATNQKHPRRPKKLNVHPRAAMFTIRTRARPSKPRRLSRRRRNPHPELPNKICLHRVLLRQVPLHKRIADGAVVAVADAAD